jgi:hypothetical protein
VSSFIEGAQIVENPAGIITVLIEFEIVSTNTPGVSKILYDILLSDSASRVIP